MTKLALWIRDGLQSDYKLISRDEFDTCANYAKLLPGGEIEVETLYRYGKPTHRTLSRAEYYNLRSKREL